MKRASRARARPHSVHHASPPIAREVREIHSSLNRLEHRLADQRSEFRRLRDLDSRANTDTIGGSSLVGLGLFLVSGVPLPDSLGRSATVTVQLVGVGLALLGILVLMRAYREWRSFFVHRSSASRGHRIPLAVAALSLLLVLSGAGYAALRIANTLGSP